MRAILFDFDGVIVNSEPVHEAAITDALASLGLRPSWSTWSLFVGLADRDTFRTALSLLNHPFDESIYQRLRDAKSKSISARLARGDARPFPGAVDLVRDACTELPSGGAVVSGSRALEVIPVLDSLRIRSLLRAIVTADDVTKTKPDPEPYLLAAERLSVSPSDCIAIEDTPVGTRAAAAAGCFTVSLLHTAPEAALRDAGARHIAPSIADLSLDSLANLFSAQSR